MKKLLLVLIFIFMVPDMILATSHSPSPVPSVPRLNQIFKSNPLPTAPSAGNPGFANLGAVISSFFIIALNIAVVLALFWLVWGVYQYIIAHGEKEGLQHARSRITWALVGLLFLAAAYLIAQYGAEFLKPKGVIIL